MGPFDYVRATVKELYGRPDWPQVVVWLTPELSEHIVSEPTTLSLPVSEIRRASPAA